MRDPVSREALTGYRRPNGAERSRIERELVPELKRSNRAKSVWNVFAGACAGGALFSITTPDGTPLRERILYAAFFVAAVVAALLLRKARKETSAVLKRLTGGDYLVLDCRAWETAFNVEHVGKAVVKIQTPNGERCDFYFLLNRDLVIRCKEHPETPLLLVRCDPGFYRLFCK